MKINNESYHSTAWARKRGRTLTSDTYTALEKNTSNTFLQLFSSHHSHLISVTVGT